MGPSCGERRARCGGVAVFSGMALLGVMSAGTQVRADLVLGWGWNGRGWLGDGTTTDRYVPTWGSELGEVSVVGVGAFHTMVVRSGALLTLGYNGYGELGDGTFTDRTSPVAIANLADGVTAVAGGSAHSLAIRNGAVWAWGFNAWGQVGDGTTADRNSPVAIPELSSGVTAVAGGFGHSLAVRDGEVWGWGWNVAGQVSVFLGDQTVPQKHFWLPRGATAVAGGGFHSMAIIDGAVWAWGENVSGQLGDGTTTSRSLPQPISSLSGGVTAIAAGFDHSLAVRNGSVWAWGDNSFGNLGDGTAENRSLPVAVDPANLTNIVSVAAGWSTSYALSADGSLWAWGRNGFGELGLGTTGSQFQTGQAPQRVPAPAGYRFTSIEVDGYGSFALATVVPVPEPGLGGVLVAMVVGLERRRR